MIAIVPHTEGAILPVVARPGARCNAVLGERAEALRVDVKAPPEKGKANAAIQSLLADYLGCKSAQIAMITGAASRQKRFLIRGIGPEELHRRIADTLAREVDRSNASASRMTNNQ